MIGHGFLLVTPVADGLESTSGFLNLDHDYIRFRYPVHYALM
jgi:hypothetical protein